MAYSTKSSIARSYNPLAYTGISGVGIANTYTGQSGDYYIGCSVSGGTGYVILPSGMPHGYSMVIKDELGRAATDKIVVSGAEGIDGSNTLTINYNFGLVSVFATPKGWRQSATYSSPSGLVAFITGPTWSYNRTSPAAGGGGPDLNGWLWTVSNQNPPIEKYSDVVSFQYPVRNFDLNYAGSITAITSVMSQTPSIKMQTSPDGVVWTDRGSTWTNGANGQIHYTGAIFFNYARIVRNGFNYDNYQNYPQGTLSMLGSMTWSSSFWQ